MDKYLPHCHSKNWSVNHVFLILRHFVAQCLTSLHSKQREKKTSNCQKEAVFDRLHEETRLFDDVKKILLVSMCKTATGRRPL